MPLTLAGHTHGGQLARRDRPRQNLALTARLSAGFYERRGSVLFVTTGVGAWFPLRVHCPARDRLHDASPRPVADAGGVTFDEREGTTKARSARSEDETEKKVL